MNCPNCKRQIAPRRKKQYLCICGHKIGPSEVKKIYNFTMAAIKHVAKGIPTCSEEQIKERMSVCERCPYFSGLICTHSACGCNVNNKRKFLNKLAWADQECPDGRWGKVQVWETDQSKT